MYLMLSSHNPTIFPIFICPAFLSIHNICQWKFPTLIFSENSLTKAPIHSYSSFNFFETYFYQPWINLIPILSKIWISEDIFHQKSLLLLSFVFMPDKNIKSWIKKVRSTFCFLSLCRLSMHFQPSINLWLDAIFVVSVFDEDSWGTVWVLLHFR